MKNLKLLMLLFLGAAISFTACNKTEEEDEIPAVKKCYVKTETASDGSHSDYTYDATSNYITKMESFDEANTSVSSNIITYTSGKATLLEVKEGGVVVMKFELTYNTDGTIDEIATFQDQGEGLNEIGYYVYTYANGKVSEVGFIYVIASQEIKVQNTKFTYTGENVTEEKIYAINASTYQLELSQINTYEYDTKNNPYRGIGLNNLLGDVQFMSANNPTKVTVKDAEGTVVQDASYNVVFVYNSDNYFTKATYTTFDNSYNESTDYTLECK